MIKHRWRQVVLLKNAHMGYLAALWDSALRNLCKNYQRMSRKYKTLAFKISRLTNKIRDKKIFLYYEDCKKKYVEKFHTWFQIKNKYERNVLKADGKPTNKSFKGLDEALKKEQENTITENKAETMKKLGMYNKSASCCKLPLEELQKKLAEVQPPEFRYKPEISLMNEMIIKAAQEI